MVKMAMVDCDVGVDDALALILAFHSPELKVKAITSVNGNVPENQVFDNIQKVLSFIHPQPTPFIARGADRPLKGQSIYAHSVHGMDGLGGATIERREAEEWWRLFPGKADELITEMARQHPGELTLVATGPLTNLAIAVQKDLEGMQKLKAVVVMGGAVRTKGNITPHAEFNIFVDPLAAKIVFESGLPVTLVPLDVTHQVFLTPQLIEERVKPLNNAFSQFLIKATGYDSLAHRFHPGEIFHLHDPLAVGVAINPDLVKKQKLPIHVETEEREHFGLTSESPGSPNVDVCLEVDAKGFLELFLSRLG